VKDQHQEIRRSVREPSQVLQIDGCICHSPLPSFRWSSCKQQGLFAPRKLLRFFATAKRCSSASVEDHMGKKMRQFKPPGAPLSEGVPQRELDDPWVIFGTHDMPKACRVFHIRERWVAEHRVVPDVEKVGGETKILMLRDSEVLNQR